MHVAFRTDASTDIGHGHVMRCLTLAHALRERGVACLFICRPHAGHLIQTILHDGFLVAELPACEDRFEATGRYASWLGAPLEKDAEQTLELMPDDIDWLVVDHYAIDAQWERRMRSACNHLLVIDDLADRPHDCDLLLDQNVGRTPSDYEGRVPAGSTVLAGPAHALLRPAFAAAREHSLSRPRSRWQKLMISMGGVDKHNVSTRVLDLLNGIDLPPDLEITVVLGAAAPWQDSVRQSAARMRWPTHVLVDVRDMASLMAESDLAIGAAGGSALERCCLGLPSVIIPVADNQLAGARALAHTGAAVLASVDGSQGPLLPGVIGDLLAGNALASASAAAAAVTDGEGAARVAKHLFTFPAPRLRLMREGDLDRVLTWRNAPDIRRWMLNPGKITAAEHAAWFRRSSSDPDRQLLIAEADGRPIGFVQLSGLSKPSEAEWGFYAAPDAPPGSGRLLGQLALAYAFGHLGLPCLRGRVLAQNEVSVRFHQKLGFHPRPCPTGTAPGSMQAFELRRDDWEAATGTRA